MISFVYPYAILLILLPFLVQIILPTVKGLHGDALRVPFLKDLQNINLKSGGLWSTPIIRAEKNKSFFILLLIYILLVLAVARPRLVGEPIRIKNEGRDILLVLDISTSMLEPDFTFNKQRITRLQAVKGVASSFIDKRQDDRIGLVLFGSRAYLQSPLTFDKNSVKEFLWNMDAGMAGNTTSIGDALGLALKSIKDSNDKDNKVIILLTDGENNDGSLSLPQAINLAQHEKVKIYTIGVGGGVDTLVQSILSYKMRMPRGLDEDSLKAIANETKGRYFRASDTSSLIAVYDAIDKLEPQSYENNYVREIKEYYYIPLCLAVVLGLLLMFMRRRTV